MAKEAGRIRRRERKNISSGVAHVNSTFNNTMITITDAQGNAIAWSVGRCSRVQGIAQVDALRGQIAAGIAPRRRGARHAHARGSSVRAGFEPGRRCAPQAAGFTITSIRDVTPIPHNGCRHAKARV